MSVPVEQSPRPEGGVDAVDTRPPALGLGRLVMAVYWLFGLWVSAVAVIDLFHYSEGPLGPVILAVIAGVVYLLAAIGLTHNGRRMRILGWVCVAASLISPLILAVAGLGFPELGAARSAWTDLGADFHYLPLLVSCLGMIWMWWSNPRRIVEIAEQVERSGRKLRG